MMQNEAFLGRCDPRRVLHDRSWRGNCHRNRGLYFSTRQVWYYLQYIPLHFFFYERRDFACVRPTSRTTSLHTCAVPAVVQATP